MYITIDDNDKFALDLEKVSPKVKESFMNFMNNLREYESNKTGTLYKPYYWDSYYTIDYGNNNIYEEVWTNDDYDLNCYSFNNVFKTKEEAEFELERNRIINKLRQYERKYNELINWNDPLNAKYYISYNHNENCIDVENRLFIEDAVAMYFPSKEICIKIIKEIGEENIKKYIFRIN